MIKEQFIYTSGPLAVPAAIGGVINGTIAIANDYNFELNYITIMTTQAGVIVLNWGGLITIQWTGTGQSISNAAVPVDAFAGNGQLPYVLPEPRMLNSNTSVTLTVANNVAVATVVNVCFHGAKLVG